MSDISNSQNDQIVTMGDWIITFILSGIPVVGFIMILVWAFGGGAKLSKRNYARAALIVGIVAAFISVIFSLVFSTAFAAILSQMPTSY